MSGSTRSRSWEKITKREIESKVWEHFQNNPSDVREVAESVSAELNLSDPLNRTEVYPYIRAAALARRIRYIPDIEHGFAHDVEKKFGLANVDVVDTAVLDDVAYHAAIRLFRSITQKAQENEGKDLYIGFSGGYTTKKIVRALADLLSDPSATIPATIVFVALVAGFDPHTPGNDPNSFFTYLDLPLLQKKIRFLLMHAAPFIEPSQRDRALRLPGVAQAAEAVPKLDIIVTSIADSNHEHGMLRQYYSFLEKSEPQAAGIMADLNKQLWCGDCLWLPIGEECGPIDMAHYPFQPFSIVNLVDFPGYIRAGKIINLVVGPCGGHPGCSHLKSHILDVVLRHKLVSHLVMDSRTARGVLEA